VTYSLTLIGQSSALTRTASTELLLHAPDFVIGLTPGVGYVEPGETITYTAILTGLYRFAEPITLSASISPGVTVDLPVGPVFAPCSVELGVHVDAGMPTRAASYPLEVVGHSASLTRTAAAELYVLNRSYLPVVIAD
jgi:hypothetical protein